MKKINFIIAMMIMGFFLPMSLNAQVFDLTTGTNGAGGAGTVGTNDPIWTMRLPGGSTFNNIKISTGLLQTGTNTTRDVYAHNSCGKWISPWLNAANNLIGTPGTTGTFTYRMQFTVDECVINPTAQLNLNFMAADNSLTAVRVNGIAHVIPAGITYINWGAVGGTPAVANGLNTIEVDVHNDGLYTALQLCGNIKVFGDALGIPENLNCCNAQGWNFLSWDPVAGATGYHVEIYYNDPECCENGLESGEIQIVTDNVLLFMPPSCYSWKVRAVNGSCFYEWSEKKCGCYDGKPHTDEEGLVSPQSKAGSNNNNTGMLQVDEVMTTIAPNPADGVVTVSIANPTGTLKTDVCELVIINLSGVQVLRESVQLNRPKEINVDRLRSGLYICKIVAGGRVVSAKKLEIK